MRVRVDPHVKLLDDRVVRRAKARGLDAVVYAPHFTTLPTIRERAARYSDAELTVIPAREVFTGSWRDRKHVLGVGLTDPVPDFITLSAAIEAMAAQDAAILVPHPEFATVSMTAADLERFRDVVAAVETYNPKHLPGHDRRARELPAQFGLPAFASSYAHRRATVGEVWTDLDVVIGDGGATDGTGGDGLPNGPVPVDAVVDALAAGRPRTIGHRSGSVHKLRCLAEFAHLGWENSWEKFDRVALSGPSATRPDRSLYAGEFDAAAVY